MHQVKKYRFIVYDRLNEIKYEIYSNKKLSKKQKMYFIRCYIYNNNFILPEPNSKVLIICDD